MKSMNDMTMEELLEVDGKINRHFFGEAHFLKKRTEDPPEWAREMNKDIKHQEDTGAFRCVCGAIIKYTEFYCAKCKRIKQFEKELDRQMREKEKSMKFMRKK